MEGGGGERGVWAKVEKAEKPGDSRYETGGMVWHFCVMRVDIVDFIGLFVVFIVGVWYRLSSLNGADTD